MAIDEIERTEMVQKLIDSLGEKPAATLMRCVYPDGVDIFATKEEMNTGFAALRAEMATQSAEDRAEFGAQRAEDRGTARQRHYWLTGTVIAVGAPVWLNTLGIIG